MTWRQTHLDKLAAYIVRRERLDADIERQVAYLRSCGAPWSVIAGALGVTRQAAQQRYGSGASDD